MQYVHMSKQKQNMVLLKLNDLLVEALSYLDSLIKDGYGLTVTEIKDFVSSLAENYDPELYSRDSKIRVLENYGDTIQFCPSYRVNVPMKWPFHQILA